jgi:DNA adenine methylase
MQGKSISPVIIKTMPLTFGGAFVTDVVIDTPKPPLKWAGGKRWLVPHLQTIWSRYRNVRLVEPFAGGLAVTLGLTPKEALLNDINVHLVNFYTHLKAGLQTELEFRNDVGTYYSYRNRFNQLLQNGGERSKEAAELFYYLNRTGFNGLCRFSQTGKFNVPVGRYKTINYKTNFSDYKQLFSKWTFKTGDFTLLKLRHTDFIYADPPYDVQFTQYSSDGFTWDDQVRTAEWLAKHPGPVVLSNQATPRVVELYKSLEFDVKELDAPRRISCTGDRTKAKEVFAIRNIEL